MRTKPRKINIALKTAILRTGRTQREIAQAAGIGEVRLSAAVQGRIKLAPEEQATLALIVGRKVEKLFPPDEPAAVSA